MDKTIGIPFPSPLIFNDLTPGASPLYVPDWDGFSKISDLSLIAP